MIPPIWQRCLAHLETKLSDYNLNTYILPLHAEYTGDFLVLKAPNQFIYSTVEEEFLPQIEQLLISFNDATIRQVKLKIGSQDFVGAAQAISMETTANTLGNGEDLNPPPIEHNLDPNYSFEFFVEGKSNRMARAAAVQVSETPGEAYNPLFIYGGVGLGKTHLMHAVGQAVIKNNPYARVKYLHSERFVSDMVAAIRNRSIDEFKRLYRSLDLLLIDDIQFFASKEHSQEEFFHTFNALLDKKQQVIMTCDRYPKEIDGLEERLKSRFSWGLTIAIEPPELEERVAILQSKAEQADLQIPNEVAFFIAKRIRSNVRELEGAMRRLIAAKQLTGKAITLETTENTLRDLIAIQNKQTTIENIKKTTAEYYKIRVSDLDSKSRKRSVTRPRQLAMALAHKLTGHSLAEIGDAFGGRDHSTVSHANDTVKKLCQEDERFDDDYRNLMRTLSV